MVPDVDAGLMAMNLLGTGLANTVGVGFKVSKEDVVERRHQYKLRLAYNTADTGTTFQARYQIDDEEPESLSPEQIMELSKQLLSIKNSLFAYYLIISLYGPWAAGRPAFRFTADAVIQRIKALGLADELAAQAEKIISFLRPKD